MTTKPPQQVLPSRTTYLAFSDESSWNEGRFRSLALATLCSTDAEKMEGELFDLLKESGIDEFKWVKLRDAQYRFAALGLIDFAFRYSETKKLRLDILIWDTLDSRHVVRYRDDAANLDRMYFHLLRNVLTCRWPDDTRWYLYPDQHTQIDWDTLGKCLDYRSFQREPDNPPSLWAELRGLRERFTIQELRECDSRNEPFIQVADLFGGLAVYSYEHFDKWCSWREDSDSQMCLLPEYENPANRGKADKERCLTLDHLIKECKSRRLGVSMKSNGGLVSHKKNNSPNFWLYAPQHEADKAPTKDRRIQRGVQ